MARTFGRLPSEILAPLVPELHGVVRPLDWYVFDVTATARLLELRQAAETDEASAEGTGGAPYVGSEPEPRDEARQRMRARVAGPRGGGTARAPAPGRLRPAPMVPAVGQRQAGRGNAIRVMGMDIAAEIPPWDPRYRG